MKEFEVLYSGAVIIEAETEDEALDIFNKKYWDYGNWDEINELGEVEEDE